MENLTRLKTDMHARTTNDMCSSYDQMSAGNFVLYDTVFVALFLKKRVHFRLKTSKIEYFSQVALRPPSLSSSLFKARDFF